MLEATTKPIYPKPRYSVEECLFLLGESRKRFYEKLKSGRYSILKDGRRTYMSHEQLMDASTGEEEAA